MARYRIGNDMTILWSVTNKDGSPFPLEGKDVRLYYTCERGRYEADTQIQGNVVAWDFPAGQQRALGGYTLTLEILQPGGKRAIKRDLCDAFVLVGKNCEEKHDYDGAHVEEGGIVNLVTSLEVYRISPIIPYVVRDEMGIGYWYVDGVNTGDRSTGESAYEYAKSKGYEGTEEEFSQALSQVPSLIVDYPEFKQQSLESFSTLEAGVNANKDLLETQGEKIQFLDESKANTTGYYPKLHVGTADDLAGRGESVPAEFSFRASGGKSIKDGAARIKRLKGNSVVWNQLINNILSGTTYQKAWYPRRGVNYASVQNGEIELRFDSQYDAFGNSLRQQIDVRPGDKIYTSYDYESHNVDEFGRRVYMAFTAGWSSRATLSDNCLAKGGEVVGHAEGFSVVPSDNSIDTLCIYFCYTSITSPDTTPLKIANFRFVNLTRMFGAGNEPTTIEDFNARKPIVADEYAYNEGEVIHMNASGVKSIGDNAWNEEWEHGTFDTTTGNDISIAEQIRSKNLIEILPNEEYYVSMPNSGIWIIFMDKNGNVIENPAHPDYVKNGNSININYAKYGVSRFNTPTNAAFMKFYCEGSYGPTYNHDILISLYHSGWKAEKDEQYQPYWEDRLMFDKRIKEAFPHGMQKWDRVYNKNGKGCIVKGTGIISDLGQLDWAYIQDDGRFSAYGSNLPSYDVDQMSQLLCSKYVTRSALDTYNGLVGISNAGDRIWLQDKSTTDASVIKSNLQGIPLYYELAEPTIIEYDEPFNLDYKVADFGTEQVIAEKPTAPFAADTIYQFNAVDMIREHELEITELQRIIATMQAQLTSLIK